tara:strand:+ start:108 stop:299 length:192 start_codon:yes stop_codon:yes gene_type:complete
MKSNFRKDESKTSNIEKESKTSDTDQEFTENEFEEFVSNSGAKGSFMIYRSVKKDDELGLDEL